jgi:hypothetical protein
MNQTFTHPGQPQMQAEVILASQGPNQKPLYSIRGRYPRIIHGEIMTHRAFSRNARSSRAVPVKTMLNEVRSAPFIPWHWGMNQKGMQASEENDSLVGRVTREDAWLFASEDAICTATKFMEAGYHKQLANRLLEPFSYIDTLITTTDLDNFLWLRDHKDAEPHLQDFARLVKQAVEAAEIEEIDEGDWHLPYIDDETACFAADEFGNDVEAGWEWLRKVSSARCAWISYKPFGESSADGDYAREMKTYEMLLSSDRVHASPLEHQATPDFLHNSTLKYRPTGSTHMTDAGHSKVGFERVFVPEWSCPHLHGNLEGYIQNRKLIPGEYYQAATAA